MKRKPARAEAGRGSPQKLSKTAGFFLYAVSLPRRDSRAAGENGLVCGFCFEGSHVDAATTCTSA